MWDSLIVCALLWNDKIQVLMLDFFANGNVPYNFDESRFDFHETSTGIFE